MHHRHGRQNGVALVIALILLAILTILAIAGASTANAELVMAGNEQFRARAADAASAGVEQVLSGMRANSPMPTSAPLTAGPTALGSSATDTYATVTRYMGEEAALPQFSAEKLIGLNYVVESSGRSTRGALDIQVQGLLIVKPLEAVQSYRRIGSGLQ